MQKEDYVKTYTKHARNMHNQPNHIYVCNSIEIHVGPDMMPIVGLALLALMDLKYEVNTNTKPVSYTHLTLPTIYSV